MKNFKVCDMLISVLFAELIGVLSSIAAGGSFTLYQQLIRPPLSPPAILFPIVWTLLYALMGVSVYLVYISSASPSPKLKAFGSYFFQLLLNFLWSIIYFRLNMLWSAAALLAVLIAAVAVMIVRFYKCSAAAAGINIPYFLWICFALYLNAATAVLN